jgi:hypothetical protein
LEFVADLEKGPFLAILSKWIEDIWECDGGNTLRKGPRSREEATHDTMDILSNP